MTPVRQTDGSPADGPALWRELGQQLRVDAIRCTAAANSGHPTSSMSAADLMAVLLAKYLRYDFERPRHPLNDHLIFSKGHASPLLYAMYKAAGAIDDAELLTFRRRGSRLQGHPTPALPWVEVATGSLGQGLPVGVGIALVGKRLDHLPYRVWVLCGDGELAEGSMAEALEHASIEGLDHLVAILDINRLGQSGETMHGWDLEAYRRRFEAYGWATIEIDGHDVDAIDRAYAAAIGTEGGPTAIIARTVKGRGVTAVADKNGFHGRPLPDPDAAIAELGGPRHLVIKGAKPTEGVVNVWGGEAGMLELPAYRVGETVATREAYGDALVALGRARPDVVVLDGEVGNSTHSDQFRAAFPERYFEMYIAEEQLVASAAGFAIRGWVPFASTFAAFLTRAHDFIRMAGISGLGLHLVGSHAGVSIGEDGPSQMGLEDLALFRAIPEGTVLYPCDANQTARLTALMAGLPGISYLRTTRGKTPVIYGSRERFAIGRARVLLKSPADRVTVVAAGVTVHEALKAATRLTVAGIRARVIDCYSVKPLDDALLKDAVTATGGRLVVVEDHHPEGGLGEAVLSALRTSAERLAVKHLAVRGLPGSATPEEQLREAQIDSLAIEAAVRLLLTETAASPHRRATVRRHPVTRHAGGHLMANTTDIGTDGPSVMP